MSEYELYAENDQYIAFKKSKRVLVVKAKQKDMTIKMNTRKEVTQADLESSLLFFTNFDANSTTQENPGHA